MPVGNCPAANRTLALECEIGKVAVATPHIFTLTDTHNGLNFSGSAWALMEHGRGNHGCSADVIVRYRLLTFYNLKPLHPLPLAFYHLPSVLTLLALPWADYLAV